MEPCPEPRTSNQGFSPVPCEAVISPAGKSLDLKILIFKIMVLIFQ
jgi:hypothetical protein